MIFTDMRERIWGMDELIHPLKTAMILVGQMTKMPLLNPWRGKKMSWLSVVGEEEDEGVGCGYTEVVVVVARGGMVVICIGAASVQVCVVWMTPVT